MKFFSVLILFFVTVSAFCQYDDYEDSSNHGEDYNGLGSILKPENLAIEPNDKTPWKNPGLTFLMSLMVPGTGYMQNDKMQLGYAVFFTEAALVTAGTFIYSKPTASAQDQQLGGVIIGAAGLIHLVQAIHSSSMTHDSNKVNGYALLRSTNKDVALSFKGSGIQLTF